MGKQVTCSVHLEMLEEKVASKDAEIFRTGILLICTAEECGDRIRAYANQCTIAVSSRRGDRVYQNKKGVNQIARKFGMRKRNFSGERLWARGSALSIVGF